MILFSAITCHVNADPVIEAISALGMRPPPAPLNMSLRYFYRFLVKLDAIEQTIVVNGGITLSWDDPRIEQILKQYNESSVHVATGRMFVCM